MLGVTEIHVPPEVDEVYQVWCEDMDTYSNILDHNAAYNVLIVLSNEDCMGPHTLKKIQL